MSVLLFLLASILNLSVEANSVQRLHEEMKRGWSCPERIQYKSIYECLYQEFEENSWEVEKAYEELTCVSPLLHFLKTLEDELYAKGDNPSSALRKFVSLWGPLEEYRTSYEAIGERIVRDPDRYLEIFLQAKKKILLLTDEIFSSPFFQRNPLRSMALHGTRIGTLNLIAKQNSQNRALRATGDLASLGIPPFAGELSGSMYTHNKYHICFIRSTPCWEVGDWASCDGKDNITLIVCTATFCQLPIVYSQRARHETCVFEKALFHLDEAWHAVSYSNVKNYLENPPQAAEREASKIHLSILRLRMTDSTADERLKGLQKLFKDSIAPYAQELYSALTQEIPFTLQRDEIRESLNNKGVVLATFSHWAPETQIWNRELFFPSGLPLGKTEGIPLGFAYPENLAEVCAAVKDMNVEIWEMDKLLVLETLNIVYGTSIQDSLQPLELDESNFQQKLACAIKQFILPYYAKCLPEQAYYPKSEQSSELQLAEMLPLFSERLPDSYYCDLASYKVAARDRYGVLRALQAAILSQIVETILAGEADAKTRYLTTVASLFFHSGRQREGEHLWKDVSAWNLREFLIRHNKVAGFDEMGKPIFWNFIEPVAIKPYFHAIMNPNGPSLVAKVIHDVEGIFEGIADKNELCIACALQPAVLKQLLEEWAVFTDKTEELKLYFEYSSRDPYQDIVKILQQGDYPCLKHYFMNQNQQVGNICAA